MDKLYYIDKIKKLLALSNSGNEAEAAAALKMAKRYMEEYSIDHGDLERGVIIEGDKIKPTREMWLWEKILLQEVAEINFCQSIIGIMAGRTIEFNFIGREVNIISATCMYDYIRSHILRQGKALGFKNTNHWNSYTFGFMLALKNRENEKISWGEEEKNALVILKKKDIEDAEKFIKENNPSVKSKPKDVSINAVFAGKGARDGREFGMNRQINQA